MPIYSEQPPYQYPEPVNSSMAGTSAPLRSPMGLGSYDDMLTLKRLMQNADDALDNATEASARASAAADDANAAVTEANAASSTASTAASNANTAARAANNAATAANTAASSANSAANTASNVAAAITIAEAERSSAEITRDAAETRRINAESTRVSAEAARVIAESGRVTAETGRVTADQSRTAQQVANNASQGQNDNAQLANDAAQDRNDLDQQRNNEAAASGYVRYLTASEYDASTGRPTISAETELRMVITPNPDQSDPDNRMLEWARRYDSATASWVWELVGGTGWKPTPATTAQADSMWDDDQTVVSSNNPDVSWMSYYRTKIRQWVTDHFVGINTIARVAQLISGGEVTATKVTTEEVGGETVTTTETHNLTDKLDASDYHRALTWGELLNRFTWGSLMGESQVSDETVTNNLSLRKPGYATVVDVDTMNDNMDSIDGLAGDIATFESSPSTASHAVGEYLLYAGHLYKVTAAIAVGDALTLGTNVTPIKVGTELNAANTAIKTLQDSVNRKVYIESAQIASVHVWGGSSANFGLTLRWNNNDTKVINLTGLADLTYESWTASDYTGLSAMRIGNIVCLRSHWSNFANGKSAGIYSTSVTLPQSIRPAHGYAVAPMFIGGGVCAGRAIVENTGVLSYALNQSVSNGIDFTMVYII